VELVKYQHLNSEKFLIGTMLLGLSSNWGYVQRCFSVDAKRISEEILDKYTHPNETDIPVFKKIVPA